MRCCLYCFSIRLNKQLVVCLPNVHYVFAFSLLTWCVSFVSVSGHAVSYPIPKPSVIPWPLLNVVLAVQELSQRFDTQREANNAAIQQVWRQSYSSNSNAGWALCCLSLLLLLPFAVYVYASHHYPVSSFSATLLLLFWFAIPFYDHLCWLSTFLLWPLPLFLLFPPFISSWCSQLSDELAVGLAELEECYWSSHWLGEPDDKWILYYLFILFSSQPSINRLGGLPFHFVGEDNTVRVLSVHIFRRSCLWLCVLLSSEKGRKYLASGDYSVCLKATSRLEGRYSASLSDWPEHVIGRWHNLTITSHLSSFLSISEGLTTHRCSQDHEGLYYQLTADISRWQIVMS